MVYFGCDDVNHMSQNAGIYILGGLIAAFGMGVHFGLNE
jgi:hypothetical protein